MIKSEKYKVIEMDVKEFYTMDVELVQGNKIRFLERLNAAKFKTNRSLVEFCPHRHDAGAAKNK